MKRPTDMTPAHVTALLTFHAKWPGSWKQRLWHAWTTGNYGCASPDHQALLQQVRNNISNQVFRRLSGKCLRDWSLQDAKAAEVKV